MSYTPKPWNLPTDSRGALPHPIRHPDNAAIALRAVADAEWSAARYPHYDAVPISLAAPPTACMAHCRRCVPAGLDPDHPLMGPHPTD